MVYKTAGLHRIPSELPRGSLSVVLATEPCLPFIFLPLLRFTLESRRHPRRYPRTVGQLGPRSVIFHDVTVIFSQMLVQGTTLWEIASFQWETLDLFQTKISYHSGGNVIYIFGYWVFCSCIGIWDTMFSEDSPSCLMGLCLILRWSFGGMINV